MKMIVTEDMLLLSIITLGLWTLLVSLWMFATRIGVMNRQGMDPDAAKHTRDIHPQLPTKVRAIGDNYINLFELPVVFYAVALAIYAAEYTDMLSVYLAWIFVGSRILHSLIQATYNRVAHRFLVFLIGLFALIVLAVNMALKLI